MSSDRTSLTKTIWIDGPPELVFEFLTVPAQLVKWSGVSAQLEPTPGGIYEVTFDANNALRGQYLELDPPRRVVFECGFVQSEGAVMPRGLSRIEISLTEESGGTRLNLVQTSLPPEAVDSADSGWDYHLGRMKVVAEGGDPGPDRAFADTPTA